MPRSSVLLTSSPVSGDVVAAAVQAVAAELPVGSPPLELRVLDEGAVLQVLIGETAVCSVLRPRMLPTLDEVARLLPGVTPPPGAAWWADAYTPWDLRARSASRCSIAWLSSWAE
jgi:hypothetical protein